MSILSWLKGVTQGGAAGQDAMGQPMQFAPGEESFGGLHMKDALDAHIAWTRRLEDHLRGADNTRYEISDVAADHLCTLGKWIHGAGQQQFGNTAEFSDLRRVHAAFHMVVGDVLNDVDNGALLKAEQALKTVRHKSGEVQLALIRLYASVRDISTTTH